ncbi:hypothetical protein WNY37_03530 [Henriciella sp. AS95]|uniref:hypothetical protein n=1 Tax=Henriciella sp. AS95 TaxID=3135782 RepID=UPI00317F53DA
MQRSYALPLLITAILQWTAPLLPLFGLGETVGRRATGEGIPPEIPLGIFFSIWSVIFLAYLVFALLAVFKPTYLEQRLTPPLLIAGAGNVVWMLSAQFFGNDWVNFLLLMPILVFAWESAFRLHRMGGWDGTGRRFLAALLTGLLSGWIAVAISISVPGLVRDLRGLQETDQVWISLWAALVPAAILAWAFARYVSRGWWFYVAFSWGLTGVVLNNWLRTGTHLLAIAAAIAGLYILWRRLRTEPRPAFQ